MDAPQELSRKAIEDFREIYEEEFGERLSDDEAKEAALRVLQLFAIVTEQPSDQPDPPRKIDVP